MRISKQTERIDSIDFDSLPSSPAKAILEASGDRAPTSSATLSAWARSNLPLRKALMVNSPALANLAPSSKQS